MTQIRENDEVIFNRKDKIVSVFFILFALMILTAQILQFGHTQKIDKQYSQIISSKNKVIQATHSILLQSSLIQRSLFNLTMYIDSAQQATVKTRLANAIKKNQSDLDVLKTSFSDTSKDEKELVDKILAANQTYQKAKDDYLLLLLENKKTKEELLDYRVKNLRPALDLYQGLQQDLLTMLINDFERQNNEITENNNKTSWTYLLMGISPYIFIMIALLYFVLNLVGLNFSETKASKYQ